MSGSVVYTVLLEDGRNWQRHAEQLRKRQSTSKSGPNPAVAPSGKNEDLLEDAPIRSSQGSTVASPAIDPHVIESGPPASSSPETTETVTAAEPLEDQETEPPEGPEMEQSASQVDSPELRRSTRERQPPDRFGFGV